MAFTMEKSRWKTQGVIWASIAMENVCKEATEAGYWLEPRFDHHNDNKCESLLINNKVKI